MDTAVGKVYPEQTGSYKIQFRVSPSEYATLARIAKITFDNGKIKSDSVNALAKACVFTKINEYLQHLNMTPWLG